MKGWKERMKMWSTLNHQKYFNFAGADRPAPLPECDPQRNAPSSSPPPPPPSTYPLNSCATALESPSSFSSALLWQSFNAMWLEFSSPLSTVGSKNEPPAQRRHGTRPRGNHFKYRFLGEWKSICLSVCLFVWGLVWILIVYYEIQVKACLRCRSVELKTSSWSSFILRSEINPFCVCRNQENHLSTENTEPVLDKWWDNYRNNELKTFCLFMWSWLPRWPIVRLSWRRGDGNSGLRNVSGCGTQLASSACKVFSGSLGKPFLCLSSWVYGPVDMFLIQFT